MGIELSVKQIIYAILIILLILIVIFGPGNLLRSLGLNINIFSNPEEIETHRKANEVGDNLFDYLNKCVNDRTESVEECFCFNKNIELPTNYLLKFYNNKNDSSFKFELKTNKGAKLREHGWISNSVVLGCLDIGNCFLGSDKIVEDGINLIYSNPSLIQIEPKNGKEVNSEFDENYVFFYSFKPNDKKATMYLVSKSYAYRQIRDGAKFCGEEDLIQYTNRMESYLINYPSSNMAIEYDDFGLFGYGGWASEVTE
ncbi:MAG: hypothetical protein ABIH25_02690 [Candidatus Woesearchaeota archaeon]